MDIVKHYKEDKLLHTKIVNGICINLVSATYTTKNWDI